MQTRLPHLPVCEARTEELRGACEAVEAPVGGCGNMKEDKQCECEE